MKEDILLESAVYAIRNAQQDIKDLKGTDITVTISFGNHSFDVPNHLAYKYSRMIEDDIEESIEDNERLND